MDSSLRNQMEASFRNQMDASDVSYYETGRRAGASPTGSASSAAAAAAAAGPPASRPVAAAAATSSNNSAPGAQQPADFTREQLLEQIINPYFEDNSPAAEAIRANAQVHIGKMSKVARSINAQAIRKIVKRASMRSHFGKVRGKPPRVPPPSQMGEHMPAENEIPDMYEIEEGDYEEEDESGLIPSLTGGSGIPSSEDRDSLMTESEDPSIVRVDSNEGKKPKSSRKVSKNKNKDAPSPKTTDVVVKESPSIIAQHPGDHLHYSLNAMKKSQPSVKAFAPDAYGQQKDIPAEVVEGTMEAGRKGM